MLEGGIRRGRHRYAIEVWAGSNPTGEYQARETVRDVRERLGASQRVHWHDHTGAGGLFDRRELWR